MSSNATQRFARLEARISPDLKELFQKAASLKGLSLTEFVLVSVTESAHRVIEEQQLLRLSEQDQTLFARALLETAEPAERLKEAVRASRQRAVE